MTCREVQKLLDLFLDGELEGRTMRAVALHVTRCPPCEAILQSFERLQDLVADTFTDVLAEVDFSSFWPRVASRIESVRRPFHLVPRLGELGARSAIAAAVAAGLVVATLFWRGLPGGTARVRANNEVRIDSLRTEASSVALLSEPTSNTTVIWVVDGGGR
jgi:anti-sigma factor RsiW